MKNQNHLQFKNGILLKFDYSDPVVVVKAELIQKYRHFALTTDFYRSTDEELIIVSGYYRKAYDWKKIFTIHKSLSDLDMAQ